MPGSRMSCGFPRKRRGRDSNPRGTQRPLRLSRLISFSSTMRSHGRCATQRATVRATWTHQAASRRTSGRFSAASRSSVERVGAIAAALRERGIPGCDQIAPRRRRPRRVPARAQPSPAQPDTGELAPGRALCRSRARPTSAGTRSAPSRSAGLVQGRREGCAARSGRPWRSR
jgi:hypothetical protein